MRECGASRSRAIVTPPGGCLMEVKAVAPMKLRKLPSRRQPAVENDPPRSVAASTSAALPPAFPLPPGARWRFAAPVSIVVAAVGCYANSFGVPFVWDGAFYIRDNPVIRQFWPPWPCLASTHRPLATWSFAVNYLCGGYNVWGYHWVNLSIHVLAGCLLCAIVCRSLQQPRLQTRYAGRAPGLALAAALLWVVHPLQTESVTYIYQRYESLMGMFFLLSVYLFIRGTQSSRPAGWLSLSIVACLASLACKEVAAVIPMVLLWYDRALVATSWRELLRLRGWYYGVMLALFASMAGAVLATRRFYQGGGLMCWDQISSVEYLLTQTGVVLHYLRLCFWPVGQCIDYDWLVSQRLVDVLPQAIVMGIVLGLAAVAVFRWPGWGFLGGWLFLILAPTSSFVPIIDPAFEHRMYLPLAAVTVGVVLLIDSLPGNMKFSEAGRRRWREWSVVVMVLATSTLAAATFVRNSVYANDETLWEDVVGKVPHNARAHCRLAIALIHSFGAAARAEADPRKLVAAQEHLQEAIRLDPKLDKAYSTMATIAGSPAEAIRWSQIALRLDRNNAEALNTQGVALLRLGQTEKALHSCRRATELKPQSTVYRRNLARVLAAQGDFPSALTEFRLAQQCSPGLDPPPPLATWMRSRVIAP